jgi:hypothetical protein
MTHSDQHFLNKTKRKPYPRSSGVHLALHRIYLAAAAGEARMYEIRQRRMRFI